MQKKKYLQTDLDYSFNYISKIYILTNFNKDISSKILKLAMKNNNLKLLQYCQITFDNNCNQIVEFKFPKEYIGSYLNEVRYLLTGDEDYKQ